MDTSKLPGRGIKPLLSLRKHYKLSALVFLLVLLVAFPVVWIKGKSYYSAESVFLVAPNYMKNMAADKELEFQSNSQYREFVNNLSNTVIRYDVLQLALKRLKGKGIDVQPKSLTERKFIEKLQKSVMVRAIPDTYMVRIILEGDEKETLDDIVNAITGAFLDTTKSEQIYGSAERLSTIEANSERLRQEIGELETRRVALAEVLGLTSFGENAVNPYDATLARAREKLTTAAFERGQAEAMLQAFLSERETPLSMGRSILEMRLQDNGLQSLRNEVVKRSEELGRTIAGLEDGHPAKKPAQAELAAINKRLQSQELEFETGAIDDVQRRLTATLKQARQVEAQARDDLKSIEAQATGYAKSFQEAMALTAGIKKREQELKDARDRLNFLQTERDAIGFVRLVTPALPAELPLGPGKTKLFLLAIVAAAGLALAVPVGLDVMDRRIYTVNDAMKMVGIPAAGWQIEVSDLSSKLFAQEQTRRFAATLIRDKARAGKNVFAFASSKAPTGTSRVLLDTAAVLQQLGLRVLVVDANSFTPEPVYAALYPGLSEFLADQAGPEELVRTLEHDGQVLSAVGFGRRFPAGVQRLDLLRHAVADWSSRYEMVLIGLPPILLSADVELLIEVLGQVFLVIEAQDVTRGEVTRAKRVLSNLDPEAVGLFVDRVPLFQGAGYMQELVLETITQKKFADFMSLSDFKLRLELWRLSWVQWRMKKSRRKSERS